MNIVDAQDELNQLKKSFEAALNDFHKRTGLCVDVYVHEIEQTNFGDKHRRVIYSVDLKAKLEAVNP